MKAGATLILWLIWILFITIIVIVLDAILGSGDTSPHSTVMQAVGAYDSRVISVHGDVSLLAWALERVLPPHLFAYVIWRGFKTMLLR